jgi:starch synthase
MLPQFLGRFRGAMHLRMGWRQTSTAKGSLNGETGILIPTAMPRPPLGEGHALSYGSGMIDYGWYIGLASQNVALDLRALTSASTALNADLRKSMGERGHGVVATNFDWSVVFAQYTELWRELSAVRRTEQSNSPLPAPERVRCIPIRSSSLVTMQQR